MASLNYHPPLGVRWLTFRLRNGHSIGPEKLRAVWSDAAETNNCSVRREHVEGAGFVYALAGTLLSLGLFLITERLLARRTLERPTRQEAGA